MATLAHAHHVAAVSSPALFLVTSARSGKTYQVVPLGGDQASCSCPAGKHGKPCSHVAAVRAFASSLSPAPLITAEEAFARIEATDPRPERSLPCSCGAGSWRAHTVGCPALTAPADVFECPTCGAVVPGRGVTAGECGPYCTPSRCRCPRACTTTCLERGL